MLGVAYIFYMMSIALFVCFCFSEKNKTFIYAYFLRLSLYIRERKIFLMNLYFLSLYGHYCKKLL